MRDNPGWLVLFLVVLAGGLTIPGRPAPTQPAVVQPPPATSDQESPESPRASPPPESLSVLSEFFGETSTAAARPWAERLAALHRLAHDRYAYEVEFLIVTAPDPIDSYSGWMFDPVLDSLQRAAEAAGFALVARRLPDPPGDAGATAGAGGLDRRDLPGEILFKSEAGTLGAGGHVRSSRLLQVFVVPETATGGVRAAALRTALEVAYDWTRLGDHHGQLLVLGPTFSGSAESIVRTLVGWFTELGGTPPSVRIVSGSATSVSSDTLERFASLHVSYQATVLPDALTLSALDCYLRSIGALDGTRGRVALLTESNTSYGVGIREALSAQHGDGTGEDASGTVCEGRVAGGRVSPLFDDPLVLHFPLHISRLRRLTQREAPQGRGSSGTPRDLFRPLTLDVEQGTDALPAYAPALTASTAELTLANLFTTLERERITTIGLLATDARDKLFLAREIRKFHPDVQLFTTESELLYAHPDFSDAFRGALVASSYPLATATQLWTFPYAGRTRRQQFSRDVSQGVYNAALALLAYDADGTPRDAGGGGAELRLRDYGPPFETCGGASQPPCRPVAWIGTVGRGELWPMAADRRVVYAAADRTTGQGRTGLAAGSVPHVESIFGARVDGSVEAPRPEIAGLVELPVSTAIVLLVISMLIVAHVTLLWGRGPWGRLAWLGLHPEVPQRARYLLASLFALLAILAAGCTILLTWSRFGRTGLDKLIADVVLGLALLLLAVLVVTIVRLAVMRLRAWPRSDDPIAVRAMEWGGMATAVVCLIWLLACLGPVTAWPWPLDGPAAAERATAALLFARRAVALWSGVSPLLPLLLTGLVLYGWGVFNLWRLRQPLQTIYCPEHIALLTGLALADRDESLKRKLAMRLRHPLLGLAPASVSLVAMLIVISANLLVGAGATLRSIEPASFGALMACGVLLAQFAIASVFLQYLSLWSGMKALLQRISLHGGLDAFGRVPDPVRIRVTDRFSPRTATLAHLTCPARQWQALRAGLNAVRPPARGMRVDADLLPVPAATGTLAPAFSLVPLQMVATVNPPPRDEQPTTLAAQLLVATGDRQALLDAFSDSNEPGVRLLQELVEPEDGTTRPAWEWTGTEAWRRLRSAGLAVMPVLQGRWTATLSERRDSVNAWLAEAEAFVATLATLLVREFLGRIAKRLMFVMVATLALFALAHTFPWQAGQHLLATAWTFMFVTATSFIVVMVQMDSNPVLSKLAGTQPGRITWDSAFMIRVLAYTVIPLLALFASQFPQIGQSILQWIEPMQKALP